MQYQRLEQSYALVCKRNVSLVVWVDGDNSLSSISQLKDLNLTPFDLHVFCSVTINHADAKPGLQKLAWVTFIPTFWHRKDTADIALSVECTHFHFLSLNRMSLVPFVFVSKDHFILELSERMKMYGRECFVVSGNRNMVFFVARNLPMCQRLGGAFAHTLRELTDKSDLQYIQSIYNTHGLSRKRHERDAMQILSELQGKIPPSPSCSPDIPLVPSRIERIKALLHKYKDHIPLSLLSEEIKLSPEEKKQQSWLLLMQDERVQKELGVRLEKDKYNQYFIVKSYKVLEQDEQKPASQILSTQTKEL